MTNDTFHRGEGNRLIELAKHLPPQLAQLVLAVREAGHTLEREYLAIELATQIRTVQELKGCLSYAVKELERLIEEGNRRDVC
jgi:hypothetical protein